jgi:outer membrane protein assembly factor BamE
LLVLSLAACSATGIPGITPYKINVQQGNVVTQDMLAKLKPGMTHSQVRYVMGTPMIADPFHPNRWDYVYMFSKHGGKPQERRITIVFDKDRLAHIEGDVVPGKAAAANNGLPESTVPEAVAPNAKSAAAGAAASTPEGESSPASASESSALPDSASAPAPERASSSVPEGASSSVPEGASSSVPPRNVSPPAPAAAGLPATPGAKPSSSTPAGLKPVMPVAPPMGAPTDAQTPYPGAGGVSGAANNPPAAQ